MLLIVAVLAFFAGGLWLTGELVANRAGQYVDQLQQYWQSLRSWALRNNMPLPQASPGEGGGMIGDVARYFAGALTSLGSLAGTLVLVFFFILLMLLEASIWRRKAQSALAWERAQALLHTVEVIAVKIRRFLLLVC